mmetsp:Transcript_5014/g.14655  ORF Transcript_5014/g.14655 Transcript_5014/m.14655 type:complete len:582 (-) Transcript_5014:99-1844(-)
MAMKEMLVEEVKELQRNDNDGKGAWAKYCEERLGGIRDPSRHDAPALQTFLTLYHQGSLEPPPAQPASSAGDLGPGPWLPKKPVQSPMGLLLVERIKALQRTDDKAKQAWWKYCDMNLAGKKDPSLHDETVLQNFLTSYNMGMLSGDPEVAVNEMGADSQPELVRKIKYLQRSDANAKQAWWDYCESHLNGKKDPGMHEAWQLRDFINKFKNGTINTEGATSSMSGASQEELVSKIKTMQRSNDQNAKEAWTRFCGGVRDPSRHTAAFLEKFLQSLDPANQQAPTPPQTLSLPPPQPSHFGSMPEERPPPPPAEDMHPPQMPEFNPPLVPEEPPLPPPEPELPPEPVVQVDPEMQHRCEEFLRHGFELSPAFGQAWNAYCSIYNVGLNDPTSYQAVGEFADYSSRCLMTDLENRGGLAALAASADRGMPQGGMAHSGMVHSGMAHGGMAQGGMGMGYGGMAQGGMAQSHVAHAAEASRKRTAGWSVPSEPPAVRIRPNNAFVAPPKTVAIKKSVTDQVRRLNSQGRLPEEIKLGRVAGSLARLDEHAALQVLHMLETMRWVEDPNEFIIGQVTMMLESYWR